MSGRILKKRGSIVAMALACLAAVGVCSAADLNDTLVDSNASIHKVFGAIKVDGGQSRGDLSAVNGSIEVGTNAQVGHVTTVNGSVSLGTHTTARSVKTVNGATRIGAASHVTGSVSTVNGMIDLAQESDVSGDLSNVNGRIQLTGAHVGGGIRTVSGDIYVGSNSRVDGGILTQSIHGHNGNRGFLDWLFDYNSRVPRIVISPGAVVIGNLRFENEVTLYVSDRASIGTVEGATAIQFAGDRPPDAQSL